MKIKLLLVFVLSFIVITTFAKEKDNNYKVNANSWTAFRICFTKGAPAYPDCDKIDVYGINFGVPTSYNESSIQDIYGLDIGVVDVESRAHGMQMGLSNWSEGSSGFQLAFGNLVKEFSGAQMALANEAEDSNVFQIGVLNFGTNDTHGFQLGLLNYMENGIIKALPLINFSW